MVSLAKRHLRIGAYAGIIWAMLSACAAPPVPVSQRGALWAKPVRRPGLTNLHEVTPNLYRGAQPDAGGFTALAQMGIHTVVNLRAFNSDLSEMRKASLDFGVLRYVHIPMVAWNVQERHVLRFLRTATDPRNQPVFVHCAHGADRTGTMVAAYRMVVQGWTADQAICEMVWGGFGYHRIWSGLPDFLRRLDVPKIRRQLNVPGKMESG